MLDRLPKVKNRRSWTGGCSGGLQRVFGLVKSDFDSCSGGSQGVRRRSGLEGIALGVEKRSRLR